MWFAPEGPYSTLRYTEYPPYLFDLYPSSSKVLVPLA